MQSLVALPTQHFVERENPAAQFAVLIRSKMLARYGGDAERIAHALNAADRVHRILRSAVGSSGLSDLTDYNTLVNGFSASLRTRGVFHRMYDDNAFVRAPARTRLGLIINGAIVGAAVDEGAAVPVSKIVLDTNTVLALRKAGASMVMTREFVEDFGTSTAATFSKELQNAVASATDAAFLAAVLETGTGSTIAATGTEAADCQADLRAALLQLDLHSGSKLYWAASPTVAVKLATLHAQGINVFGAMSPLGGELINCPVLISDAVGDNELHVIDASQIAADLDTIDLRQSQQGDMLMQNGIPPMNSTDPLPAQMISLFQDNLVGSIGWVYFASERLRPNSTATITGIDYGA